MRRGTEIIAVSSCRVLKFPSVSEASRHFGIDRSVIRRLVEKELPIRHEGVEWWVDEMVEVQWKR